MLELGGNESGEVSESWRALSEFVSLKFRVISFLPATGYVHVQLSVVSKEKAKEYLKEM